MFLDELLQWRATVLEALREPLETGTIALARGARRAEFPARFQLVAATNPCPCGFLGSARCQCSPQRVARYRARLSAPLLERFDLAVEVYAESAATLIAPSAGESSQTVRARVSRARARALQRQALPNAQLSAAALEHHCALNADAQGLLGQASQQLQLSARGLHRVLRVARTIADLAEAQALELEHLAEAVALRVCLSPIDRVH